MTNFAPMRNYTFGLADEFIEQHGLRPPFIDIGCGQGDFSRHLATRHGWTGVAADSSPGAASAARAKLSGTGVQVDERPIETLEGMFNTVVLSTVIEHIREDDVALGQIRALLPAAPGAGHLLMSMPTNPEREWRWDDDFYGHYRRYTRDDVDSLLQGAGFRLLDMWDYTFPVFWAMRRVYTRVLPAKTPPSEVKEASSAESSLLNPWGEGRQSKLIDKIPVWGAVGAVQRRYRAGGRGFEAIAVATTA